MRRITLAIFAWLIVDLSADAQIDRITGKNFATRSEVVAHHGMVCTSVPLATQVGNITRIHNQPGADTGEPADTQCFQHDYLRRMTGAWTPRDGNCAVAPSAGALGGPAPYWH